MSDLRAACIHGRYEMHGTESTRTPLPDGGVEISNLCNGGRVVTIDYKAALAIWYGHVRHWGDEGYIIIDAPDGSTPAAIRSAVDAAIGDTEDRRTV